MGTTARLLYQCQENMQKFIDDLRQDGHNRSTILQDILEEHKQMRKSWEESAIKTQQQIVVANNLRKERNQLLRELLQTKKE